MTATPEIRLIAVDLDGTLLNNQHQMTPRTERALTAALARGVGVVIATGKTRAAAEEIIARLKLTTPGVYNQGLLVVDGDGSIPHQQLLDRDTAFEVIDLARAESIPTVIYNGLRLMAFGRQDYLDILRRYEPTLEVIAPDAVDSMPINKLMLLDWADRLPALRARLNRMLGARVTLVQAVAHSLEVLPPGASKGSGLKVVLDHLGIDPQNVMAIGDGENDLSMIEMAGVGVAMGNAYAGLKAAADYVTATNDEDGVALAVERYVLGPTSPSLT